MDDDCVKGQSFFVVLDRPSQIAVFNLIIFNPFINITHLLQKQTTLLVNDEMAMESL